MGKILSGPNAEATDAMLGVLADAYDALLAYERAYPLQQADAFRALENPNREWEIA